MEQYKQPKPQRSMKEARQAHGLSQVELSILIHKSVQTIRNYEQGWHNIPPEVRLNIVGLIGDFTDKRHS